MMFVSEVVEAVRIRDGTRGGAALWRMASAIGARMED
jgi:hypothetical protein